MFQKKSQINEINDNTHPKTRIVSFHQLTALKTIKEPGHRKHNQTQSKSVSELISSL